MEDSTTMIRGWLLLILLLCCPVALAQNPAPEREFIPILSGDLQEIRDYLAGLLPKLTITVDPDRHGLLCEGPRLELDQARELMRADERPLNHVLLEFQVIDLTEGGSKKFGSPSRTLNFSFHEETNLDSARPGGDDLPEVTVFPWPIVGAVLSPLDPSRFAALESLGECKTLARHRLALESNQQGVVTIQDKIPLVDFDPVLGQFAVQYFDSGLKFALKPSIQGEKGIQLDLTVEVSTVTHLISGKYPITSHRTGDTTVKLEDGETMVIGGLIRDQDIQALSRIPILGEQPRFGAILKAAGTNPARNEVILPLRAQITH